MPRLNIAIPTSDLKTIRAAAKAEKMSVAKWIRITLDPQARRLIDTAPPPSSLDTSRLELHISTQEQRENWEQAAKTQHQTLTAFIHHYALRAARKRLQETPQ